MLQLKYHFSLPWSSMVGVISITPSSGQTFLLMEEESLKVSACYFIVSILIN